ncbi:MAG: right-handed parallel beta-helix repeat-containing protein, partial [Planctomycetota bacterium]
YSSIQSAIDNGTDGDVIEVAAGMHYESIDFKGKSITVRSFDPNDWEVVQETIIDANGGETTVYFGNSEGADSVLKGFKITGGASAGVYCSGASPTIGNCLITLNGREGGDDEYGGMYNYGGASPDVTNCVFSYNDAEIGGGMYNRESSPTVTNCVFYSNEAEEEDGGGMCNDRSSPTIINCTFYENECEYGRGGAIYNHEDSDATVSNCIFWNNRAKGGEEIYNKDSQPTFSYCCIRGGLNGSRCGGDASINGRGNINDNPGFYDHSNPAGADRIWGTSDDGLRPVGDSPCIDSGDNSAISEPSDIAGNTRKTDAANTRDTGNGTAPIIDMGAYEYNLGP